MLRHASWTLLLASCAVAPQTATVHDDRTASAHALRTAPPADFDFMPLRLGVEYLPPRRPASQFPNTGVFAEPTPIRDVRVEGRFRPIATGEVTVHDQPPTPLDDETTPWNRDREELERIEDPAERLTMLFVDDLIGEDRRRMRRELMTPLLTNRLQYTLGDALRLPDDEQRLDEEADFFASAGSGVIRRPLRKLLKRATFLERLEIVLDEFKADNVPLSNAYREKTGRTSWGRVSMRVRLSDGSDPVEMSYYNSGWRFGSSKEHGRIQYRLRLADRLEGALRYSFDYETHDTSLRADLRYVIDADTNVYVVAGDKLEFLSGPTTYSFVNSPLDGSAGVLFYVEHDF